MASKNARTNNSSANIQIELLGKLGVHFYDAKAASEDTFRFLSEGHRNGSLLAFNLGKGSVPGIERRRWNVPGMNQLAMGLAHGALGHWPVIGSLVGQDGKYALSRLDTGEIVPLTDGKFGDLPFTKRFAGGPVTDTQILNQAAVVKLRNQGLVWSLTVTNRSDLRIMHTEISVFPREETVRDIFGNEILVEATGETTRNSGLATAFRNWNRGRIIAGKPEQCVALSGEWEAYLSTPEGQGFMAAANRQNVDDHGRSVARKELEVRLDTSDPLDRDRMRSYVFGSSVTCWLMACRAGVHFIDADERTVAGLYNMVQQAGLRAQADESLSWWAAKQAVDGGELPFTL